MTQRLYAEQVRIGLHQPLAIHAHGSELDWVVQKPPALAGQLALGRVLWQSLWPRLKFPMKVKLVRLLILILPKRGQDEETKYQHKQQGELSGIE